VAEGAGLLVDPTDTTAIAEAIGALLGDGGLAARLGGQGRDRAATFTWDRSAELMAAVYAEAVR
jgi:glycosyltransferase involved in cell wall biosynthesis